MIVTLFYKIGDAVGSYAEPVLYAYTNNKILAKTFKQTRKMDSFIIKEKDIDDDEFYQLCARRPSNLLIKSTLLTRDFDSFNNCGTVTMALTKIEEETAVFKSEFVYEQLYRSLTDYAFLLNDEIIDALKILGYWDFYKYQSKSMDEQLYSSNLETFEMVHADQFEVFMFFFGDTMNMD